MTETILNALKYLTENKRLRTSEDSVGETKWNKCKDDEDEYEEEYDEEYDDDEDVDSEDGKKR